ncbi:MAG: response regulator [Paludibacteraceae bacterium]|nr:response regulator [Paludibacteraceae bacterium]
MRRFFYSISALFICLLNVVGAHGEIQCYFFHYTTEDGLASNNVHDIVEDKYGFIWLATHYGISRFDGCTFRNYDESHYPEMKRNDTYHAFVLPNGDISFGGSNFTVYSYDYINHTFKDISAFADEDAYNFDLTGCSIQPDGDCLISSTGKGVFSYDKKSGAFHAICNNLTDKKVLTVSKDFKNRYWIGCYNGVYIVDKDGNSLFDYRQKIGELINNILQVDTRHILLCSTVGSLWMAEMDKDGAIIRVERVSTPFHSVSAISKASDSTILIGTSGDGLWQSTFINNNLSFEKIKPINKVDASISKVSSIFIDSKKRAWVSTNDNGIWCIDNMSEAKSFSSIELGIPKSVGTCFFPCGNGQMLMGTDGAGLLLLDANNNLLKQWSVNNGLPSNNVLAIEKYQQGYLLSFWGGNPVYLTLEDGILHPLETNKIATPVNTVKNILKMKDGSYLLSTGGYGVYNLNGHTLSNVQLDPKLLNDSQDLWMEQAIQLSDGTIRILSSRTIWSNRDGYFKPVYPDIALTNSKNPLLFLQSCENNQDGYFVLANKGIFWFAADDSSYEALDFLPSGEYFSFVKTDDNKIWASSADGILSIDYENKTYETVFSAEGLSGDYFVRKASYVSDDGKLLFGCKHGFVCINPKFINNDATEHLSFSELYINGKKTSISNDSEIVLEYGQTHLLLKLDMVNYAEPNTYSLKYRVMPADTIWNKVASSREITIDVLPDGDFNLEVGVFSANGNLFRKISLPLSVLPPWWKSTYFYLFCTILFITLGFFISNRRVAALKRRKEELQKAVDKKTVDLRNANETLVQQKNAIEEKNESLLNTLKLKDQLVSVVAHDLKNPMFAIVTTLRRIMSNDPNKEDSRLLISKATLEAEKIQSEMENLLQWASNSDNKMKCEIKNVDLAKLVTDIISFLQPLCNEKEILLESSFIDLKHHVLADEKMLAVVVRNLISNAIKYTGRGKSIKVGVMETTDKTILTVADEGIGMTPEFLEKIRNRENIVSRHGTENEKGYGMGLKIVSDFVSKMGAAIDFASESGVGTQITVSLNPGSEIEHMGKDIEEPSQQNIFENINKTFFEGKTVLVVDDDTLLLDNIKAMLSSFVTVQTAGNGEECMELAEKTIPDLIISDIDMPKMNGIDMCKNLALKSTTSNIPVLFLSAKQEMSTKIAGLSAGAIDYIVKPFNEGELLLKTSNFLRMQQLRQIKILAGSLNDSNDNIVDEEINPLIQQLLDCIKENYVNPDYSFNDIAKDLGFSKSTLTRRLKSIIDKSPVEILSEYRLHKAKSLLAEGKLSVSEIAYAVGFNDPSYFSRKYKDYFGTSPSK